MKTKTPLHFATDAEIRQFIQAKKIAGLCPACGDSEEEWSLYGTIKDEYHPHIFRRPTLHNTYDNTEWVMMCCFSMFCNNCGYLRTFAKSAVKKWLGEQNAAQQQAE